MQSVTSLDISVEPHRQKQPESFFAMGLFHAFPNLRDIDMSNINVKQCMWSTLIQYDCIKWNASDKIGFLDGDTSSGESRHQVKVTEICVDDSCLYGVQALSQHDSFMFNADPSDHERYLWKFLPNLERVSMRIQHLAYCLWTMSQSQ